MKFKKITRLNESVDISNKREILRKQNLITPGRNAILAFIKKWGSVTESALSSFIGNLNETNVITTMEWVRENGNYFKQDKRNQHMFISLSELGEKVLESSSQFESVNVEIIGEGKLATIKRKYTNNHPAKTVQLVTPVRNKILSHVAEKEKVTRSEFIEFLKQMNEELGRKTTFKWVTRNAHFFTVAEDKETKEKYWTLSQFGKRVLSRTTVNENISATQILNEDYADALIKANAEQLGIDITQFDMDQLKLGMEIALAAHGSAAGDPADVTGNDPMQTLRLVIGNLKLDPNFYTKVKPADWGDEFFDIEVTGEEPEEVDADATVGQTSDDGDQIPGGKADGKTIPDIAKHHNVSEEELQKEHEVGKAVEMEHTDDPDKADEIAKDHLAEDPKYYTNLVAYGLVDEPEALKLAKDLLGVEPKKKDDDNKEGDDDNKEGDDDNKEEGKLLSDEQKSRVKEMIDNNATDEDFEKFAKENDINIEDLKAYIELIKDKKEDDDKEDDDKNESHDTDLEFKPIVGNVKESIVTSIQENKFKNFKCIEENGSYKIYDSEDNHIATLTKVDEDWQIHSSKTFEEIEELMLGEDVNEDDHKPGSLVKIKSTGQTGTVDSWSGTEKVYKVLLDDGTGTVVDVPDDDIEMYDVIEENHNKPGSKVKIKSTDQTGTIQGWHDAEGVYTILLDDGGETIDVPDEEVVTIEEIGESKVNEMPKNKFALSQDIITNMIELAMQYTDSDEALAAANNKWTNLQELVDYLSDYIKPRDTKAFMKAAMIIAKQNNLELHEMELIHEDHIKPGAKVKCKCGKTGTVQSWEDNIQKYIVLTDDGETLEYEDDELTPIAEHVMELGKDYNFTNDIGTVIAVYENSFVVSWDKGGTKEIEYDELEVKETDAATVYNVPGMGNVMLPGSGEDGSGDRFDNDSVIPANAGLNRKMGRYQMKKLLSMDNFIKNSLQESKTDIATELTSDKWKKHLALTYTEVKVDADGDNYKIYLKGKAGWKLAFDIKGDRVEFERLKDDKSQKAPFYLSTPQAEIYSYLETKGYKMKGFRD